MFDARIRQLLHSMAAYIAPTPFTCAPPLWPKHVTHLVAGSITVHGRSLCTIIHILGQWESSRTLVVYMRVGHSNACVSASVCPVCSAVRVSVHVYSLAGVKALGNVQRAPQTPHACSALLLS